MASASGSGRRFSFAFFAGVKKGPVGLICERIGGIVAEPNGGTLAEGIFGNLTVWGRTCLFFASMIRLICCLRCALFGAGSCIVVSSSVFMLRSIPSALRIAAAHRPAAGNDGCSASAKVAAGENAFRSHYRGEARFPSPDPHPMAAMRHGGPGNASHQALWNLIVLSLRA